MFYILCENNTHDEVQKMEIDPILYQEKNFERLVEMFFEENKEVQEMFDEFTLQKYFDSQQE